MHTESWIRGRVHYGWIVVGVTFLALLGAAGVRSTPGVLMIPLEREFGWTRATVSFAVSLNIFLYGLAGPFVAGLMDRAGSLRGRGLAGARLAPSGGRTARLPAGVGLAVLPLVAVLMRDDPRDIGLRPFGERADGPAVPRPPRAAANAPLVGLALGLRSRDFCLLAGSFFICGLSTNGLIGTHLIPASMEHGIPEVTAATRRPSTGVPGIGRTP